MLVLQGLMSLAAGSLNMSASYAPQCMPKRLANATIRQAGIKSQNACQPYLHTVKNTACRQVYKHNTHTLLSNTDVYSMGMLEPI